MRGAFIIGVLASLALLAAGTASANPIYPDPAGGWTYVFTGDAAAAGTGGFTALDGTWSQDNGSDSWDGTGIGVGAPPGGASALTEGSAGFLRMQDTGDPRDYAMPDPSSRKLYFGHDIGAESAASTIVNDGVTISMRARVATGTPLDDRHPDGGGGIVPWPATGDGYLIHDGGKGSFGIKGSGTGIVSFSLATASDLGLPWGGLIMNNLNGSAVSGNVDTGEAGARNLLLLANPTDWHEFWITIKGDTSGGGTHRVDILADGLLAPFTFHVTAGDGNDYSGSSYLALGLGNTGQSGAIDVDFFAYKSGAFMPIPEPGTVALMLLGLGGLLAARRRRG